MVIENHILITFINDFQTHTVQGLYLR